MTRSLGRRFAWQFGLLVAVLLGLTLASAAWIAWRTGDELHSQMRDAFLRSQTVDAERALLASGRYVSGRLFNPLYRADISAINEEIAQVKSWLPVISLLVLDPRGRVLTDGTEPNPDYGRAVPIPPGLSPGHPLVRASSEGRELFLLVGVGDEVAGYARLVVSDALLQASLSRLDREIRALWSAFWSLLLVTAAVALALLTAVTVLLGWRLSRSLSRPLDEMMRAARLYAAGNLDHQLAVEGNDEIGMLARALNAMARELKKQRGLLARSQEIAGLGSWEWEAGAARFVLSEGAFRVLGEDAGSFDPTPAALLSRLAPGDVQSVVEMGRAPGSGPVELEATVRRGDGQMRVVQILGEPQREADGRVSGYLGTVQDITERRRSEQQLARMANYDPLTGLPNRHLFRDRLDHATRKAERDRQPVALLFLDLDGFKSINDALGHAAGDELLKLVAGRMLATVRQSDTVARLGGDEFTVIVESPPTSEHVAELCERLLQALAEPYAIAGRSLYVSASIGVTLFPRDGHDIGGLLRNADTAMYLAKEQGKGTYRFFTPELDRRVHERVVLEQSLRRAVAERAFELHYQPQVRLNSGKLAAVEALLRWRTEGRLESPARFIPVLEETGLITALTGWLLRAACLELAGWRAGGLRDLRVAVNLSAAQLQQTDLIASIRAALDEAGLPADALELEITESTLIDAQRGGEVADALQRMGVRLAIDDFGTGYSSLAYLRRYSVETLKIDRSFIQDIASDADSSHITAAVIALSRRMGIETVAEGVENLAQQETLRELGCDMVQGYLVARPLPPERLMEWASAQELVDTGCYWRSRA